MIGLLQATGACGQRVATATTVPDSTIKVTHTINAEVTICNALHMYPATLKIQVLVLPQCQSIQSKRLEHTTRTLCGVIRPMREIH